MQASPILQQHYSAYQIITQQILKQSEARFPSRGRALGISSYGLGNDFPELLSRVWRLESNRAPEPNLAKIATGNNVREPLLRLGLELIGA